jgi:hypothetical protein
MLIGAVRKSDIFRRKNEVTDDGANAADRCLDWGRKQAGYFEHGHSAASGKVKEAFALPVEPVMKAAKLALSLIVLLLVVFLLLRESNPSDRELAWSRRSLRLP